ncbi:MAG: hypothetical protein RR288_07555 [Oscillibacter sp.]
MEGALFHCPASWEPLLPLGVRPVRHGVDLENHDWDLLALTPQGCAELEREPRLRCRILLVPGTIDPGLLARFRAETVISYGLSHRDSLTLSSLAEPVLCVQRTLPRPDGTAVEPQEFPLGRLPDRAEELLALLGVRLLALPDPPFPALL